MSSTAHLIARQIANKIESPIALLTILQSFRQDTITLAVRVADEDDETARSLIQLAWTVAHYFELPLCDAMKQKNVLGPFLDINFETTNSDHQAIYKTDIMPTMKKGLLSFGDYYPCESEIREVRLDFLASSRSAKAQN